VSIQNFINSCVVKVFSNLYSFAALKINGSIVTWGHIWGGINKNYNRVIDEMYDIKKICSTYYTFVALRNDGRIFLWGFLNNPNISDENYLMRLINVESNINVEDIETNYNSLVIIFSDGTTSVFNKI
jgi:hypothetical protein